MFTANAHKNTQGYCQPSKDSICYNLPLHIHDEDHFHHPQILKLASGKDTEWILNRNKKHNKIYQKVTKKLLQRQSINNQNNSRFMPATDLKIGTFVLIPNFNTQKGISKKLQPIRKGSYQIIDKPTEVTYKLTDSSKKEIIQNRNNFLPYYPKITQKERKNRKLTETILSQDQQQKSDYRESSRIRNQPRKNYKTFIPQSKILKKVEFQKQL